MCHIAQEVLDDDTWPRGAGSLICYRAYLESQHAVPEAIAAFERAWQVYLDETAPTRTDTETSSSLSRSPNRKRPRPELTRSSGRGRFTS